MFRPSSVEANQLDALGTVPEVVSVETERDVNEPGKRCKYCGRKLYHQFPLELHVLQVTECGQLYAAEHGALPTIDHSLVSARVGRYKAAISGAAKSFRGEFTIAERVTQVLESTGSNMTATQVLATIRVKHPQRCWKRKSIVRALRELVAAGTLKKRTVAELDSFRVTDAARKVVEIHTKNSHAKNSEQKN